MDTLFDVLGFAAKSLIVFLTFAACTILFIGRVRRSRGGSEDTTIKLRDVSARWRDMREAVRVGLLPAGEQKAANKARVAEKKREVPKTQRIFVVDFKGDVLASAVEDLREEVTAIVGIAAPEDEVVLRLESPGGAVHGYGLAASQLDRLRARKLRLTICVDRVAASGGYMMACVASELIAAPFAVIGSIGVVAPLPNVHRALEKLGVDYEDVTAGKYKRTTSLLGQNTPEGIAKLRDQLEETHDLFKKFVKDRRPTLDIEAVATGEYWYGTRAIELGLVDRILTSDDYLLEGAERARVLEVTCQRSRTPRERLLSFAQSVLRWGGLW